MSANHAQNDGSTAHQDDTSAQTPAVNNNQPPAANEQTHENNINPDEIALVPNDTDPEENTTAPNNTAADGSTPGPNGQPAPQPVPHPLPDAQQPAAVSFPDFKTALEAEVRKIYRDNDQELNFFINPIVWENTIYDFAQKYGGTVSDIDGAQPVDLVRVNVRVQTSLNELETAAEFQETREMIDKMVARTDNVKRAVCLGLGKLPVRQIRPNMTPQATAAKDRRIAVREESWSYQYATFVKLCNLIDEKQAGKPPITRTFQDPAFNTRTKYMIQRLIRNHDHAERNAVVEAPKAMELLGRDAFLYGIHLPSNIFFEDVLQNKHLPQLIISNDPRANEGGLQYTTTDLFLNDVYWGRKPEISDKMVRLHKYMARVAESHDRVSFFVMPEQPAQAFNDTSIYVRKKKNTKHSKAPITKPQSPLKVEKQSSKGSGFMRKLSSSLPGGSSTTK